MPFRSLLEGIPDRSMLTLTNVSLNEPCCYNFPYFYTYKFQKSLIFTLTINFKGVVKQTFINMFSLVN